MNVTVDKSQMPLCNTPYDVGHDVKNTYTFKVYSFQKVKDDLSSQLLNISKVLFRNSQKTQ